MSEGIVANPNDFLKKALEAQGGDSARGIYLWLIDDIVGIIDNISGDDTKSFDPSLFPKVEQLFNLIISVIKGEKSPEINDSALTYVFNTTLGKTIDSFVAFSLRVARATGHVPKKWGQEKYERFFNIGIDAYIWFGCFLPQIIFLDKDYAESKVGQFVDRNYNDFEWRMFIEGYLSGQRFYKDVYFLMRPHYIKALDHKVLNERMDENLVHHVAIGYLHGYEALQKDNPNGEISLFWKMLSEAKVLEKTDRWLEAIGFFWSITPRTIKKEKNEENNVTKEEKNKIIEFWKWAYDNRDYVKNQLGENYDSFLSKLAELTLLLEQIDSDSEKWLLLSAPHVNKHHHSTFFLEYLTKFEDEESIKRLGRIFLKLLEKNTPMYHSENILLLIERLYKVGEKDVADEICTIYGKREVDLLKELWQKNQ